jgi:hypothetical protein
MSSTARPSMPVDPELLKDLPMADETRPWFMQKVVSDLVEPYDYVHLLRVGRVEVAWGMIIEPKDADGPAA